MSRFNSPDGAAALYRVRWEIDVYADSPRHAAQQAIDVQRRSDSTATVFEVTGPDGVSETIDLLRDL